MSQRGFPSARSGHALRSCLLAGGMILARDRAESAEAAENPEMLQQESQRAHPRRSGDSYRPGPEPHFPAHQAGWRKHPTRAQPDTPCNSGSGHRNQACQNSRISNTSVCMPNRCQAWNLDSSYSFQILYKTSPYGFRPSKHGVPAHLTVA